MAVQLASTLASWVPAVLRCLKHHGLDKDTALIQAGIDQTKLYVPDARYSIHDTHRLMQLLQSHLNSPAPGLELAKFADQNTFGALGLAINTSQTLHEALKRLAIFSPLLSNVVRFSIHTHQQSVELRVEEGHYAHDTPIATFDFCLSVLTRFLRFKGGRKANPIQVTFMHRIEAEALQQYQSFFNCDLVQLAAHYSLFVPIQNLDHQLLTPISPAIQASLDAVLEANLLQLETAPLSAKVLESIMRALPNGEPTLTEVASELNISGRTLQRRLKDEGSQFKEMLDEGRKNLSQRYLKHQGYNVTETAYLLGFSDTSSFSRAYKRWFNQSPSHNS